MADEVVSHAFSHLLPRRIDPEPLDARRDLRAARLAEHIESVVAAVPPLTPHQVEKLRSLLPTSSVEAEPADGAR